MAKITKVPNGPLIKKKGPFKGSTLKTGGTIKKAQAGAVMTKRDSTVANIKEQARLRQNLKDFQKKAGSKPLTPELVREKDSLKGLLKDFSTKQRVKGTGLTEQQLAKNDSIYTAQERKKKSEVDDSGQLRCIGNDKPGCSGSQAASERRVRREARRKNGGPIKKAQLGRLVKKAVKKTSDDFIPVAEKNLTRVDAPYNKKGLNMAIERRLNPEAAKKKMTKAQRRSFEVDDSYRKNGGPVKKAKAGAMIKRAQNGESFTKDGNEYTYTKQVTRPEGKRTYQGKSKDQSTAMKIANFKIKNNPSDSLRTVKPVIKKNGGMIKRADGSMSRRGLWDNIRANKGSGKKPTKQMLVQEKKIKAKTKK